jgi:hypothetical protein
LFSALIILVILVFSVLTAAREKCKEDIDDFLTELSSLGKGIQEKCFTLFNIALSDIEIALLTNNGQFINMLRKARGLPELPLPQKTENTSIDGNTDQSKNI